MTHVLVTNDFPPRPGGIQSFLHGLVSRLPPDDVVVYPGHRYSVASMGTLDAIKDANYVFKPKTKEAWLTIFSQ